MSHVPSSARGAALLEVIVALGILGIIGSTAAGLAAESVKAVHVVHDRERDLIAADRFLTAVSMWPRADLDRHLGTSQQGPWDLRVDRRTVTLYAVSLRDTTSGRILLTTSLFRDRASQ